MKKDNRSPWAKGCDCRAGNVAIDTNPFIAGTDEYSEWISGWESADFILNGLRPELLHGGSLIPRDLEADKV